MTRYLKYIIVLILSIVLVVSTFYQIDKKSIKWNNFKDGLKLAKFKNKKVLINVYTDWCKWCKKMESEVFPNAEVLKYINEKFIPIKFNGEAPNIINYFGETFSHSEFIAAFGINGFPATIFLTSEGEPITVLPGYHKADEYLKILKFIGDDIFRKMNFDEYLRSYK